MDNYYSEKDVCHIISTTALRPFLHAQSLAFTCGLSSLAHHTGFQWVLGQGTEMGIPNVLILLVLDEVHDATYPNKAPRVFGCNIAPSQIAPFCLI